MSAAIDFTAEERIQHGEVLNYIAQRIRFHERFHNKGDWFDFLKVLYERGQFHQVAYVEEKLRRPPKQCVNNSINASFEGNYGYAEGLVCTFMPHAHAWNTTPWDTPPSGPVTGLDFTLSPTEMYTPTYLGMTFASDTVVWVATRYEREWCMSCGVLETLGHISPSDAAHGRILDEIYKANPVVREFKG